MIIGVTGSNGALGSELVAQFTQKNALAIPLQREAFRLEDGLDNTIGYLKSTNCNILVHCAANTDVEYCESEVEVCYRDNTLLTELLFQACRKLNVKFVFISSTGVYGDYKESAYIEYDVPNPTTVHHKSKYIAENIVLSSPDSLVIRTGWLFGGSKQHKKNFVLNRIKEAQGSSGVIYSDNTQIGNPTSISDLAIEIIKMIHLDLSGVFNCVNTGAVSRFLYVKEIIKCSGLSVEVKALDKPFKRVAKVSKNEAAINFKLQSLDINMMNKWEDALERYVLELKKISADWSDTSNI